MNTQRIITLRLPELCSYPQELMFSLYLFLSLLHHICNLFPFLYSSPSLHPLTPSSPPPPKSCQDAASAGLRLNGGIWLRSPLHSCSCFFKSTHVYAPNLCTLCFSTSRHELEPRLMRPGSPLWTCSEGEGG